MHFRTMLKIIWTKDSKKVKFCKRGFGNAIIFLRTKDIIAIKYVVYTSRNVSIPKMSQSVKKK